MPDDEVGLDALEVADMTIADEGDVELVDVSLDELVRME